MLSRTLCVLGEHCGRFEEEYERTDVVFVVAAVQIWVEVELEGEEIDDEVAAIEVCLEFELVNDEMCTTESAELATWVEAKGLTYVVGLD